MRSIVLTILAVTLLLCAARPAQALPEPYAGIGLHTFGLPGKDSTTYSGMLEGGVDDIIAKFGLGARLELPDWRTILDLQLRYSLFKVPFIRVFVGAGAGIQRYAGWNGTFEGFVGARLSLGLPYIGATIGVAHWGGTDTTNPYGTLSLGLSF